MGMSFPWATTAPLNNAVLNTPAMQLRKRLIFMDGHPDVVYACLLLVHSKIDTTIENSFFSTGCAHPAEASVWCGAEIAPLRRGAHQRGAYFNRLQKVSYHKRHLHMDGTLIKVCAM
jgi:hypothetical protein